MRNQLSKYSDLVATVLPARYFLAPARAVEEGFNFFSASPLTLLTLASSSGSHRVVLVECPCLFPIKA